MFEQMYLSISLTLGLILPSTGGFFNCSSQDISLFHIERLAQEMSSTQD